MKQIELAKELGISKSYLSMILSSQRKPNPDLANKLRRHSGELVHKKAVNSKARFCLEGSRSIQLSYRDT
jgi:Helix-turn-helix.